MLEYGYMEVMMEKKIRSEAHGICEFAFLFPVDNT